jgi:hypothetical protein
MKKLFYAFVIALLALPAAVAYSDPGTNADFNASRTFEFDPDKTNCPVAYWKNGIGEADRGGKTSFGLQLEKNCPTATNASAGAVLNGISGTEVTTLGYDLKNTSPCEAGSPRFNVTQADGTFHFVGGCANGAEDAAPAGPGWTRLTFQTNDPTDAFPVLTPGVPVTDVVLIVDDQGKYTLDNIQVNGAYADSPGSSGALP